MKKLRKEGKIYLGSKWQKRYCVVRNHVLYYFREKKAKEQAGQILLPGYKAQVANKRGREFTLTHSHSDNRAYQVHACKVPSSQCHFFHLYPLPHTFVCVETSSRWTSYVVSRKVLFVNEKSVVYAARARERDLRLNRDSTRKCLHAE